MKSRYDRRRNSKFDDACTDNSCIMWVIAIFKGNKLPNYIDKNTPKKWRASLEDIKDYIDLDKSVLDEIKPDDKIHAIIAEFEFSWVDDPKKNFQDQIYGMNLSGWLCRNENHKNLVYATAWNKID